MANFLHNSSTTGAIPLGPRQHEEFDELCALAAVRQLPDQDWERLRAHLEYCDVCKESLQSHAQFNSWLTASLLAEADEVAEDSRAAEFDLEAGERRLMDSLGKGHPPKIRSRRFPNAVLIFALSLASITSALAWHEHHERTNSLSISAVAPGTSVVSPTASISAPPRPLTQTSDTQGATPSVQSHEQMLENQQLKTQIATLTNQLASGQQEQAALQQQVRASEQSAAALSQQLAQAQEEAVSLRGQMVATASAAQTQRNQDVRELQLLRTTVEAKNKAIAETEDLLAHDRDIRDLMGARPHQPRRYLQLIHPSARNLHGPGLQDWFQDHHHSQCDAQSSGRSCTELRTTSRSYFRNRHS